MDSKTRKQYLSAIPGQCDFSEGSHVPGNFSLALSDIHHFPTSAQCCTSLFSQKEARVVASIASHLGGSIHIEMRDRMMSQTGDPGPHLSDVESRLGGLG